MNSFKVAIDGPAGSGKSTISGIISKRLGFTHIDTGAMYRAVTLAAIEKEINLNNEEEYHFLETTQISYHDNDIYLDGRNVSEAIRSKAVTDNVSLVASFPYVREKMVAAQQLAISQGMIIMDGRDIGTVVMTDADLKIFLTANVEERARRRKIQQAKKGLDENLDNVIENIKVRDKKDSQRELSPLKQADDAVVVDTTNLTLEQTVEKIIKLINNKKGV